MKRLMPFMIVLTLTALLFSACSTPALGTDSSEVAVSANEATSVPEPAAESSSAPVDENEQAAPMDDYGEYQEVYADDTTRVIVFGSDEVSFQVASTLIIRNNNALLVDTKFSKTDAQEIIRFLNDSNSNLTQIFISHGDPDYYFGLEEFRAAFPDAAVGTTTSVAQHIEGTIASKLEVWAEALGDEIPTNFIMPENLVDTEFDFEGLNIQIFGSDPTRITLYIPALNMLLGGANITNGNHLFLADMSTEQDRAGWVNNLTELQGLNAAIVIPGHTNLATETFDGTAIDFSIDYLEAAAEVLPTITTSEEFITEMQARYPNLNSPDVLGLSGAEIGRAHV